MKNVDCKKFPNVATKPTKHEQTNESPTIQFFPEKNFHLHTNRRKQGPGESRTQTLGHKGNRVSCRLSGE